jgi:hypothetical protein
MPVDPDECHETCCFWSAFPHVSASIIKVLSKAVSHVQRCQSEELYPVFNRTRDDCHVKKIEAYLIVLFSELRQLHHLGYPWLPRTSIIKLFRKGRVRLRMLRLFFMSAAELMLGYMIRIYRLGCTSDIRCSDIDWAADIEFDRLHQERIP